MNILFLICTLNKLQMKSIQAVSYPIHFQDKAYSKLSKLIEVNIKTLETDNLTTV